MKKFFVYAILASLVACKEKGDSRTPKGIIITAVQALSEGNSDKFRSTLSEVALQKYGTVNQQSELKNQLGNVRKLILSDEKVLSQSTVGNSTVTLSQVDVLQSGRVAYNVVTRCTETTTSSTHQVCNTYDPNPPPRYHDDDDYDHGGHSSGGSSHEPGGSYSGGSNHDYITPGDSHPATGGGSGDGHKPGNQDPDRPPRFPIIDAAYSTFEMVTECHDVTSRDTSVSCKIIDLH